MAKPKPGDKIYVETTIYVTHGVDDFQGGLCTVAATRTSGEGEHEITEIEIEEDPNNWMRWEGYLEPKQEEWEKEYSEQKGRLRPDFRPEFNTGFWDDDPE